MREITSLVEFCRCSETARHSLRCIGSDAAVTPGGASIDSAS